MTSASYYRDEAQRFRELAKRATEQDEVRRLLQRAVEYDQLAQSLDFMPASLQPQ